MADGRIKSAIAHVYRYIDVRPATVDQDQQAALSALGRYTWRFLLPPAWLQRCVTAIDSHVDEYTRVLYVTERRRVVHAFLPAPGHQRRHEQPLPDPNLYDPWAIDEDELIAETNVIARCPACGGVKKVICSVCSGAGRVLCGECRGGGRVQGQRGVKNCPTCRGKGDVRCDFCTRGMVGCDLCDRTGRVETWLKIDTHSYLQVRAHPHNAALSVHTAAFDPTDLDAGAAAWPNRLTEDTGNQSAGTLKVSAELAPQTDPFADRVVSERMQRFASGVHRIEYETALSKGAAELAGIVPRLTPNCDWKALQIRVGVIGAAGLVVLIAGVRVVRAYSAQSEWHERFGDQRVMAWFLFAALLASVFTVAGLTLPRRTWGLSTTWAPLAVASLSCLATIGTFFVGGPTREEAERALAAGDLTAARIVGQSLIDADDDPDAGRDVLDQVHLGKVFAASTLQGKRQELSRAWFDSSYGGKARAHLLESARATAERQAKACDVAGLDDTATQMSGFDDGYAEQLRSAAALCRVPRCKDCDCIVGLLDRATAVPPAEKDKVRASAHKAYRDAFDGELSRVAAAGDADAKVTALTAALAAAPCVGKLGTPVERGVVEQLRVDLREAERAAEAERQRAAAEAERQRLAEEVARKREEAIEQAREATRRVQCCDGTVSPSCLCSRSSRRGCCSHHGGVCGCE